MRKTHKRGKKHSDPSEPGKASTEPPMNYFAQPVWQTTEPITAGTHIGTIQILDPLHNLDSQNFQNSHENAHNQFANIDQSHASNHADYSSNLQPETPWDWSTQGHYGETSFNFVGQQNVQLNTNQFPTDMSIQRQWTYHNQYNQQICGTEKINENYGQIPWTNIQQENKIDSDYINLNTNQNLSEFSDNQSFSVNSMLQDNLIGSSVNSSESTHGHQSFTEYSHNSIESGHNSDNQQQLHERKNSWLSNSSLRSYNSSIEPPSLEASTLDDVSQKIHELSLEKKLPVSDTVSFLVNNNSTPLHISESDLGSLNLDSDKKNQSLNENHEIPQVSSHIHSSLGVKETLSNENSSDVNSTAGLQAPDFFIYQSQSAPVSTRVSPLLSHHLRENLPSAPLIQKKNPHSLNIENVQPRPVNSDSKRQITPLIAENNKELPYMSNQNLYNETNLTLDHHLDIFMNPIEPKESSAFQPLGKSQHLEMFLVNDQKLDNVHSINNKSATAFEPQMSNVFNLSDPSDNSSNLETIPDNAELPLEKSFEKNKLLKDILPHSPKENVQSVKNIPDHECQSDSQLSQELKKTHSSLFQKHQRDVFNNSPSTTLWANNELPPVNIFLAPAAPPNEVNQQIINDSSLHSKEHTSVSTNMINQASPALINIEQQNFMLPLDADSSVADGKKMTTEKKEPYFKPVIPVTSSPSKDLCPTKETELDTSLRNKNSSEAKFDSKYDSVRRNKYNTNSKLEHQEHFLKNEYGPHHFHPVNENHSSRRHKDSVQHYPPSSSKMETSRHERYDYEYRDRSRPSSVNSGNEQDASFNHDYYDKERPSSRISDRPRSRQGSYWDRHYQDYYDYRRDDYYRREKDPRMYGYDYDRYDRYDRERYARYDEYYRHGYYAPHYSQYDKGYYAELNNYGNYHAHYPYNWYGQYRDYAHYDEYEDRRSIHSNSSSHSYHEESKDKRDHYPLDYSTESDSQRASSHDGLQHSGNYQSQEGNTYFDPTTRMWYVYDYNLQEWKQTEDIPSTPHRLTPTKYNNAHVIVRFGPGGQLIKVLPNLPQDGQPAIVEIHETQALINDEFEIQDLKSYPGPLIKGETHKNDVLQFCLMKAKQARENIDLVDQKSRALLWELLVLLIRQNGTVVGTDISELLLQDHEIISHGFNKITRGDKSCDDNIINSVNPCSSSGLNEEDVTNKFRELLLFGHKKDALEWAMKNGLWGHALFLGSKMDSRTYARIMTRFANSLILNDPIQTLYQLMSGRQPAAVTSVVDELWGDWRPHLAMVLSNHSSKPELDRKSIIQLGDTLAVRGCLDASHFCYLMADVEFGEYHKKSSKLVLLGSSHYLDFLIFANNEAIQFTEVYEYAQSLANSGFFFPHLQCYKFIYACRLAEQGLAQEALRYCEVVAGNIQASPDQFGLSFIKSVYELANKLKYYDPVFSQGAIERLEQDELPWLQRLKNVFEIYDKGIVESSQDSISSDIYNNSGSLMPDAEISNYPLESSMQYDLNASYGSADITTSPYVSPSTDSYSQNTWNHYENSTVYNNSYSPSIDNHDYKNIKSESRRHSEIEEKQSTLASSDKEYYNMVSQIMKQPHKSIDDSHHLVNNSSSIPSKPKSMASKSQNKLNANNQKSWFSGIFNRFSLSKNEMKLPDDKNPKIVWDPAKKLWVNNDETEEEGESDPMEPPKDFELIGTVPSQPISLAGVNRFQRIKGPGMKQNYVDVLNPVGSQHTSVTGAEISNLFPIIDSKSQMPNLFIPTTVPVDKLGDTDFLSKPSLDNTGSDSTQSKDSPSILEDSSSEFSRSSSVSTLSHEVQQYTQSQPPQVPVPAPDLPQMFNPAQFHAATPPSYTSKGLGRYGKPHPR